jgi:hypothetical protein
MHYVTAQILLLLTKINEALQKQNRTIDSIEKSTDKYREVSGKRLEKLLTIYEKAERNKGINDNRHHDVQSSICYAAWATAAFTFFAFIAAAIYACLAYGQWNTAKRTLEAQTRPWIGLRQTPNAPDLSRLDSSTTISLNLTLHNFGDSPAVVAKNPTFRIGRWTKKEIRFALGTIASEKGTATDEAVQKVMEDICKPEPMPAPGHGFARFSAPIYQGEDGGVTATAVQDSSRSRFKTALFDDLLGCIVYTGSDEKMFYRLLVLYTVTPSEGMTLEDTQIADDPK